MAFGFFAALRTTQPHEGIGFVPKVPVMLQASIVLLHEVAIAVHKRKAFEN